MAYKRESTKSKTETRQITPSAQQFKDSIFECWGKGGGAYIIGGNTSLALLIISFGSATVFFFLCVHVFLLSFQRVSCVF